VSKSVSNLGEELGQTSAGFNPRKFETISESTPLNLAIKAIVSPPAGQF
jgi:hypothetical protein